MLAAAGPSAFGQIGYPGRMPASRGGVGLPSPVPDIGSGKQPGKKDKNATEPLADLKGTVKSLSSKLLVIEDPESNTLQFECSKKTHYYQGDKKVKASALKPGDHVAVEAKRDIDGTLEAVNVRFDNSNAKQKSEE
jgi:hypothetical protein